MRRLGQGILLGLLLALGYLNIRLYYRPDFSPENGQPINRDVVAQLRFLRGPMHAGAGQQMQGLYPEGFVYLNALYALAWLELLPHLAPQTPMYEEGLAEAGWAVREIQSPNGSAQFINPDLPLPNGAFYQGWSAYVLGRYLAAQPAHRRDTADVGRFRRQCALIARALAASPSPYLESYAGAAWPADGVLGVAALAGHDRLYPARYQPLLRQWVQQVKGHLDQRGLIPHRAAASNGQSGEDARGSSQSQLLNFLLEVDSTFARQQFQNYRRHFLTSRLGLPGIREAAHGAPPTDDIDSGPVVWGVGGAASLVGRRTMQCYADSTTAVGLRNSIEGFGVALTTSAGKRYLFGQLPIADAFIAWGNSVEASREIRGSMGWRGWFQLLSALVAAGLLAGVRGLRPRRQHSQLTA
ncbi:hypothetical protein [Hymenobacter psychrophilus]|uniref:Uncharacterized protein n=1 Tax=Hymenobacter psychrophilus TaxID=651662 RepID=A0A1H3FJ34_9BACT|nr:hypothetical protein [Hymenobacter psychrophilus]SDX90797.1 hypothetical protein SAMN04488069_10492 [Hymenobacter psychrophilus]